MCDAVRGWTRKIGVTVGSARGRRGTVWMLLWESFLLGVFGAVVGAVVSAMTAGVLNSANIHVPLSVQLFLMSDALQLSVMPSALGGAIALIWLVTAAAGLYAARWAARHAGSCQLALPGERSCCEQLTAGRCS